MIQWAAHAQRAHPELQLLFHVPNGEARDARTAAKLRWMGVKPGVPDLLLPVPRGPYTGLALEMKRRKGGGTTEAQERFLEALRASQWHVCVCRGADEAIGEIRRYVAMPHAPTWVLPCPSGRG